MGVNISLGNILVGDGCPVFVIAEIGINHGGSIDEAMLLVRAAAEAGANAVKFQTYITEKRTPKGSPIYDILKKCELPFSAFNTIKALADQIGIQFFSTPFDDESINYLETIKCPYYKIASFDIMNLNLIQKIALTKKPVLLSVGMSDLQEISRALEIIKKETNQISLLHCVTSYPTDEKDANLSAIRTLYKTFDHVIGQSDHTSGIDVPVFAVAAGAKILEKHFMMSDSSECPDAPVSISKDKMKELIARVRRVENILGSGRLGMREVEKKFAWLRRKQ